MKCLQRKPRRGRGFTLLEILVVMFIAALLMLMGFPALYKMINRSRLQGLSTEVSNGLRLARFQAIKNSRPAIYSIDPVSKLVLSWVDDNDDSLLDPGEQVLRRSVLQSGTYLAEPPGEGGGAINGFGGTNQASFNADGSVDFVGGFRFCDDPDNNSARNFLEVRVTPRSVGRVEVRKWYPVEAEWFGADSAPSPWVWY